MTDMKSLTNGIGGQHLIQIACDELIDPKGKIVGILPNQF